MTTIGERFNTFRRKVGMTQAEIADKIKVSRSFLSQVESDLSIPGGEMLMLVNQHFGLNINWLLTGEGEMFQKKEDSKQEEKKEEKSETEHKAQPDISAHPSSAPQSPSPAEPHKIKQLEQKVNYLYKLVSARHSDFQPLPTPEDEIQIPFYTYRIPAGTPDLPPDDHHEHLILDKKLLKRPKNAFAVRVSGTSMIGAGIADGDIIVVDRTTEPIPNKIVVVSLPGEGYTVKTLQKRKNGEFWLKPANPRFKSVKLTPAVQASIVGRVVLIIKQP